ncbi:MAG: Bax inhibitor-1/YccA family protein [Defluviitaleaceae bacterium]|nr:Bax inhibitor-1/YccA family protein [Defluviitaleaceae bacterium]
MKSYYNATKTFDTSTTTRAIDVDPIALNRYITKVFGWTFLGLLATSATVLFFIMGLAAQPDIFVPFISAALNWFLFIAIGQLIFVFIFTRKIETMRPATAKLMYMIYAISMGLLFTWVALVYNLQTIGTAFLLTSVSFGFMAVYGVVTKQDLTRWGNILMFALIGLVLAIVVNMFLGNTMLDTVITIAGIFIFLALTVYDANRIKSFYSNSLDSDGEATAVTENLAIFSALGLYLNFINLFLFMLRFLRD